MARKNPTAAVNRPMTIKLSDNESLRSVLAAYKVRMILAKTRV